MTADVYLRSSSARFRYAYWIVYVLFAISGSSIALDVNAVVMLVHGDVMECIVTGETSSSAFYWRDLRYNTSTADTQQQQRLIAKSESNYVNKADICPLDVNGSPCNPAWEIRNWNRNVSSLAVPLLPLLDRRWEALPLISTANNAFSDGVSLPSTVTQVNVGVSLLESTNKEMLLCEDDSPTKSRCYRIIVNGPNSTSKLMKCDKNWKNGDSSGSCRIVESKQGRIGGDWWLHLMVQWNSNTHSLKVLYNDESDVKNYISLFSYVDPNNHFNVNYFFVGGNEHSVMWKLHNYNVLSLMIPYTGNKIQSKNDDTYPPQGTSNVCLEFFYRFSHVENLINMSATYPPSFTTIRLETDLSNGWNKEKRLFNVPNSIRVQILGLPSTDTKDSILIDSIRECSRDFTDIRVLTFRSKNDKQHIACQNVLDPKIIVKYTAPTSLLVKEQLQPMIDLCVLVHNETYCQNSTVMCNKNGCACPIGFTGKLCENRCPRQKYGYNCSQDCGQCLAGDCHHATGLCCSGCKPNYALPYCVNKNSVVPGDEAKGDEGFPSVDVDPKNGSLLPHVRPTMAITEEEGYPWGAIGISAAVTTATIFIVMAAVFLGIKLTKRQTSDKKVVVRLSSILRPEPATASSPRVAPLPTPVKIATTAPVVKYTPVDYSPPPFKSNTLQTPTPSFKPKQENNSKPTLKFTPVMKSTVFTPIKTSTPTTPTPASSTRQACQYQRPMIPLPSPEVDVLDGTDDVEYLNVQSSRDDPIYVQEDFGHAGKHVEEEQEEDLYENLNFQNNSNARFQQKVRDHHVGKR